jgi:hypothetical protein
MADSDCCGHRPVYGDGCVRSTIALRWIIVSCPFVGLLLLLARLLGIGAVEFNAGAAAPFRGKRRMKRAQRVNQALRTKPK